jgi:superfamily II DNA or RNA helicase
VERVIVSRDFVKRWENLRALENVTWDVVVIDECHHFVKDKHQAPTRLRELAEKIVYKSPGLLLISATPFTGSRPEFHSLLKLLDPKFQEEQFSEAWDPQNPYLVRRLKGQIKGRGEVLQDRKIQEIRITEEELSPKEQELLREVAEQLAASHSQPDAESWDRLLEETARKRLSSSWEAFYETITGSERLSTWFSEKTKDKIRQIIESKASGKMKALLQALRAIHAKDRRAKVVIFTEAIASQLAICDYLLQKSGYAAADVATIRANTPREERLL